MNSTRVAPASVFGRWAEAAQWRPLALNVVSIAVFLAVWHLAATIVASPFFPQPWKIVQAFIALASRGDTMGTSLWAHCWASLYRVLVGFAADGGGQGLERAREKRRTKNADLFVFNDVSRADIGFDGHENEVTVLSEDGERLVDKAPKREIAAAVLDEVERLLSP